MDFGFKMKNVPIFYDNANVIQLSKNINLHSRTKPINIRHHFLCDHISKGDIKIKFIGTTNQLADIFTKLLDKIRFCFIRREPKMINTNRVSA